MDDDEELATAASDPASPDWPDNMPDTCPPGDAGEAQGVIHRLVENDPPTVWDFTSHLGLIEAGRLKPRRFSDDCLPWGISVFTNASDLSRVTALKGFRNRKIATGDPAGSGVMKATGTHGDSHHTWWRPMNDDVWKTFEVEQQS